ncbi:MAG: glycosyltransferase 87 family protein [Gaiellaceae bacterium]
MSSRSESWSRPADYRIAAIAAVAIAVFIGAWVALHHGWLSRGQITDTPVYERYGDAIVAGHAPYRDFSVEYPPGALPAFAAPSVFVSEMHDEAYTHAFETLMAACGIALLVALAFSVASLGFGPAAAAGALGLVAVAPLLLGTVVLTRFDLWPAALTAGAMAAILCGRLRLGHGLLGAGVAAKLWPGVLLPLTVAHVWRTRGRREAFVCLGIAIGVVVAVVLPFLVISPDGVWTSFSRQLSRPLQIESIGAALIVAGHHVLGTGATMISSRGSQNLSGGFASAVGVLQSVVQLGVLVGIWFTFARRDRSREELVRYSAATVVAFVALGKVLSPQFLIWLIPLVPLVRRWSVAVLYAAALVLTQAWFPKHYWSYALHFSEAVTWLVLLRDLVLLGLLVALLKPPRKAAEPVPVTNRHAFVTPEATG